jgi:hypothetical protein
MNEEVNHHPSAMCVAHGPMERYGEACYSIVQDDDKAVKEGRLARGVERKDVREGVLDVDGRGCWVVHAVQRVGMAFMVRARGRRGPWLLNV